MYPLLRQRENPLFRGEGAPKGRERNAGGDLSILETFRPPLLYDPQPASRSEKLHKLSAFRPHSSSDPLTRATFPPGEGIFRSLQLL